MSMLIVGECKQDHRYELLDPTALTEWEFENHVAKALMCYRPTYVCAPFHGTFNFDGTSNRPDLALVARDGSHWFVIEVELASHSLDGHVIPQVRTLRYGTPEDDCIASLAKGLGISTGQARQLLTNVPRRVGVVANRRLVEWERALRAVEVELLTVSVYRATSTGVYAYEVDGALSVTVASVGFGRYSATDRAIVFPRGTNIRPGPVQIIDEHDGPSLWNVVAARSTLWVVKDAGDPGYGDGTMVQLMRTLDGQLSMRRERRS
jgi:hypothetical protein